MTDKKRDETDIKFNVHIPDRRKPRPVEDQKVVKFKRKDEEEKPPAPPEGEGKSLPLGAGGDD